MHDGPEAKHTPKAKYPVLYLLHGGNNDYSTWLRYTSIEKQNAPMDDWMYGLSFLHRKKFLYLYTSILQSLQIIRDSILF